MMNRQSKAYKGLTQALETLFLALAGLYLIYSVSRSTTFYLKWPAWFETGLMRGLAGVALVRLLVLGPVRWETPVACALGLVYGAVFRVSGYEFLLFLAILTAGFIAIDYRKILAMYLATVGVFYAITVLGGLMGVITNFVTARAGRGVRSAWGMSYYTDFASLGLFLLMALWVSCRRLPGWAMATLCGGFICISGFIAHSNTSTFCAGLLLCAMLYCAVERRFIENRNRMGWLKKGPELFATLGFPLLALVMFALILAYARGMNPAYRLNGMLSNRLMRGATAWKSYGLKPFGTPFEQHGSGFSTFPSNVYNFVDSTYPLVLLRYGWVTLLALGLSWVLTARRVVRSGDRRLLWVMGIIAVHAFSEHHFTECDFNLLVTMPLAAFAPLKDAPVEGVEPARKRAGAMAWSLTALLFAAGALCFAPALLARLKTALELMHYGHGEHSLRLFCVLGGALFALALAFWAVGVLVRGLLLRRGLRACRPALAALLACALLGGGAWLFTGRVIDRGAEALAGTLEADRPALEIALRTATGKVRSGVLPALYRRSIGGLSDAAFFEDDLCRLHGDTVLMPSDAERGPFIDNGFLYVPISDEHALYTGDRAVVEALADAGYHPTGHYSSVRAMDLEEAADRNDLYYDPETGARLAGLFRRIAKGPWQDLYGGKYTVTWDLALPEGVEAPEGKLCTLRVTAYKGDELILEKVVKANKLDDDGHLSVSARFKIEDSRDVAFEAQAARGVSLDVRGVHFARTPDYDVHTFYDARLRKIREEYYGADGQPTLRKEGWFACDYTYDRQGNPVSVRYYDRDGQPTLISGGYAEHIRAYNARGQVIREEYRDADGQLVLCSQGYAADEREYDRTGNPVVQRYFGPDGQPYLIRAGYAEIHRTYNEKKQVVREAYFGTDGAPIALPDGYWGLEKAYDRAENVTVRRYLDASGAPMLLDSGYAELRRTFDGQHQVVGESYHGLGGEPVVLAEGYAALSREYDEAGNIAVERCLGPDGAPVLCAAGYARIDRVYDGAKRVVEERYYGVDDRPIPMEKGQCGMAFGYDDAGNVNMRRYLDAGGQPTLVRQGYAEVRSEYDGRRLIVRETYFGTAGEPVVISRGYAEIRREYNDKKQKIRESYYGIDGQPVMIRKKYTSVEYEYDAAGEVAAKRYYDRDGKQVTEAAAD